MMVSWDGGLGIDQVIDHILETEGWPKYTNDPADAGGPTKGGITLKTLEGFRKMSCTPVDVAKIEEHEARTIYKSLYIDAPGFTPLNPVVRFTVVDCGVLCGTPRASFWLQQAINAEIIGENARRSQLGIGGESPLPARVKVDGRIGPFSVAAANALPEKDLCVRIEASRLRFLARAVQRGDNIKWSAGWFNRSAASLENAMSLL